MADVTVFVEDGIVMGSTIYCISFCLLYFILLFYFICLLVSIYFSFEYVYFKF